MTCVDGQIISCHVNAFHTRSAKQAVIAIGEHVAMDPHAAPANGIAIGEHVAMNPHAAPANGMSVQAPRPAAAPASTVAERQKAAFTMSAHTVANPSLLFGELTDVRPSRSLKWKTFEPETQRFNYQDS